MNGAPEGARRAGWSFLTSPRARPLRAIVVDGRSAPVAHPSLVHLDDVPMKVEFVYEAARQSACAT